MPYSGTSLGEPHVLSNKYLCILTRLERASAAPRVAALAAYFKVLPTRWAANPTLAQNPLFEPSNVKRLITRLHRQFDGMTQDGATTATYQGEIPELVNVVWNGQDQETDCLLDPGGRPGQRHKRQGQNSGRSCPLLPAQLSDLPLEGTLVNLPPFAPDPTKATTAPPLPNLPTLSSKSLDCSSTTTTVECNGPPDQQACVTKSVCYTPPPPTTTTTPEPAPTSAPWAPPVPTKGFWLGTVYYAGVDHIIAVPDDASSCKYFQTKDNPIGFQVIQQGSQDQLAADLSPRGGFSLTSLIIPTPPTRKQPYHSLCGNDRLKLWFRAAFADPDVYGRLIELSPDIAAWLG